MEQKAEATDDPETLFREISVLLPPRGQGIPLNHLSWMGRKEGRVLPQGSCV
jgi:hypothetical protein